MEGFLIFCSLVLLIIVVSKLNSLGAKVFHLMRTTESQGNRLEAQLDKLAREVQELRAQAGGEPAPAPEVKPPVPLFRWAAEAQQTQAPAPTTPPPTAPPVTEPVEPLAEAAAEAVPDPVSEPAAAVAEPQEAPASVKAPFVPPVAPPPAAPVQPAPEANAWETFIGENLINKIGIAILTLGIGIFVKYAFDQHWVNAVGRVVIGLLAGSILAGVGHYLRRSYVAFSSVLVGGALATFYFTIGLAYHEYALLTQMQAFFIMVGITSVGVAFAYGYKRVELAVIALVGGFLTPFLVSNGQGNYIALFSYIAILNLGMFAVSWVRNWRLVFLVGYFFTLLLYGSWLGKAFDHETQAMGALFFATLFFVELVGSALVFQVRMRALFKGEDIVLLLSVNLSYFAAGVYILHYVNAGAYQGVFVIAQAAANLALAAWLRRRQGTDFNLLLLLLGVVISLVTVAVPIQLDGNAITLFWSAEMVVLLWLYLRSNIKLLYTGSWLMMVLAVSSWVIDAAQTYSRAISAYGHVALVSNKAMLAGAFLTLALVIYRRLHKRVVIDAVGLGANEDIALVAVQGMPMLVGYLTGLFEVVYQSYQVGEVHYSQSVTGYGYAIYTALWLLAAFIYFRRKEMAVPRWLLNLQVLYLVGNLLISYFFTYYLLNVETVRGIPDATFAYVAGPYPPTPLWMLYVQYVMVALSVVLAVMVIRSLRDQGRWGRARLWTAGILAGLALCQQLDFTAVLFFDHNWTEHHDAIRWSQKVLYPIAWGVVSFILVGRGIQHKNRDLRLLGLGFLALALAKLFLIDIWSMSTGWRISAFISLGVLLLVVSFMYQRLKKLVGDK